MVFEKQSTLPNWRASSSYFILHTVLHFILDVILTRLDSYIAIRIISHASQTVSSELIIIQETGWEEMQLWLKSALLLVATMTKRDRGHGQLHGLSKSLCSMQTLICCMFGLSAQLIAALLSVISIQTVNGLNENSCLKCHPSCCCVKAVVQQNSCQFSSTFSTAFLRSVSEIPICAL